MDTWTVQAAKARFSEFLQSSLSSGPHMVAYTTVPTGVTALTGHVRRNQRSR